MPGNRSAPISETDSLIGDGIPLLDQNAELIDDELVLPGNKCLLSLNLTKNRISEPGVQHFLRALQYQESFIKLNISTRNASSTTTTNSPTQGLLRLELQKNDFVVGENEAYEKIRHLLAKRREPIFKSKDNADETSMGGRDTVGTPHTRSRTGWISAHQFTEMKNERHVELFSTQMLMNKNFSFFFVLVLGMRH